MSSTTEYVNRLTKLQEGERSRLRRLAGCPLDRTLGGFDLFAGLWWPLRSKPQREPSWLVAKLFGASGVPYTPSSPGSNTKLPHLLGCCEPRADPERQRFRNRFDALLCSSLATIEPHLRWALGQIARAIAGRIPHAPKVEGLDWGALLDDLYDWDSPNTEGRQNLRHYWAETYLNAA